MPSLNAASIKPGLRKEREAVICATTRHTSTQAQTLDRADMWLILDGRELEPMITTVILP